MNEHVEATMKDILDAAMPKKREGHTPGPWAATRSKRADNTGGYDYAITDEDHQIIAETFEHTGYAGGSDRQYIIQPARANAKLIIAAPDLLRVLRDIVSVMDNAERTPEEMLLLEQAQIIIASATT